MEAEAYALSEEAGGGALRGFVLRANSLAAFFDALEETLERSRVGLERSPLVFE